MKKLIIKVNIIPRKECPSVYFGETNNIITRRYQHTYALKECEQASFLHKNKMDLKHRMDLEHRTNIPSMTLIPPASNINIHR